MTRQESLMLETVEYIRTVIEPLVNHPECLEITHQMGAASCVIQVTCPIEEFGQLCGKRWRNAESVRGLLASLEGRHRVKYVLEFKRPGVDR